MEVSAYLRLLILLFPCGSAGCLGVGNLSFAAGVSNSSTQKAETQIKAKPGHALMLSFLDKWKRKKRELTNYVPPTITRFQANNYVVDIHSNVSFTCQAEGNPTPQLYLRKDGQKIAEYSELFQNANLELTFIKHVRECKDGGVYECCAQKWFTITKQVEVNVKCAYQLEDNEKQNKVYTAVAKRSFDFTIRVIGYPDPFLQVEGLTNALDANTYKLSFGKDRRPPYVYIKFAIYEVGYENFQNYTLSITNTEGTLVYNFRVVIRPTITRFDVNGDSGYLFVELHSKMNFICQAEGGSPHLSLTKDGKEIAQYSDPFQNEKVELTFIKHVSECTDAGEYSCCAKTDFCDRNNTLVVRIKCVFQLADTGKQNMVYRAFVNSTLSITIPVIGYPYPVLQLEGLTNALDTNTYKLAYLYGDIVIRFYNVTYLNFQNYILNITNGEGTFLYYFSIVEDSEDDSNVGGLVGGIVAGILVIVAAIIIIVKLKRKGCPKQNNLQESSVKDVTQDTQHEEIGDIHSCETATSL